MAKKIKTEYCKNGFFIQLIILVLLFHYIFNGHDQAMEAAGHMEVAMVAMVQFFFKKPIKQNFYLTFQYFCSGFGYPHAGGGYGHHHHG